MRGLKKNLERSRKPRKQREIELLLREIRPHDKEGCVKTVNKKPEKSQPPRLDNIAVSLFVDILVDFGKY